MPTPADSELEVIAAELMGRLNELGITWLADTTGLDRLGIPTWSCPATRDRIWVYSGKGETVAQAQVSAIMECVERTAALWDPSRVIIETGQTIVIRAAARGPPGTPAAARPRAIREPCRAVA